MFGIKGKDAQRSKLSLFQVSINIILCHQQRSDLKSLFKLVLESISFTLQAVPYTLLIKVRPHLNTLLACCSNPMRDNISFLVAFFLVNHKVVIHLILAILSACLHVYSVKCYSHKSKLCRRPLYFSIARGCPVVGKCA